MSGGPGPLAPPGSAPEWVSHVHRDDGSMMKITMADIMMEKIPRERQQVRWKGSVKEVVRRNCCGMGYSI